MKRKYLAIGINFEQGSTCSIEVETTDAQSIANLLCDFSQGNHQDEILLCKNGRTSPNVIFHWNLYRDYLYT